MDMSIPFHVLEESTEGFSDTLMIGSGGYGKVYKGVYNEEDIAVKLFHDVPALDNKQFEDEFFNLLKIKHPNVVRLVGYCYETQHKHVEYNSGLRFSQHIYRILCFEFLQGGSLEKYLNESRDHDWPTCYDIIKGTCEGLNFLHGGSGSQIVHLDLKPANILLDKDMRAKVADFGLARFFSKTQTHITNTITGTEDYMPPEFRLNKQISPKNDVYSLGVIIIGILAGHTGYSEFREMDDVKPFIELVITNWREWIYATTSLFPSAELHQVETCIKIAIKCVDPEIKNRPTVAEILDNLQETEKRFHLLGQRLPTPTKSGQKGGRGGRIRDIEEKPWRLTSLAIFCIGVIDGFSFSYFDQSGKKQHVGPWGTDYSNQNTEMICFGPSEFVKEVSGTYGSYRGIIRVISLTFVTNVRTYGPLGNPYQTYQKDLVERTHFRFMADEGSSIVGFHGRSGSYIDAIGVYMSPIKRTTVGALSVPLILDGQPSGDEESTLPSERTTYTLLASLEMNDQATELKILEDIFIDTNAKPARLSYPFMKSITRNFSQEIGRGGFGVVYMGHLGTGKIAVKKLSISQGFSDTVFADEINCLLRIKHKNVVRFLGYCADTHGEFVPFNGSHVMAEVPQRLLCFEYVPNGNLQKYLKDYRKIVLESIDSNVSYVIHDDFNQDNSRKDEWQIRYQIIRGICHGLNYLHNQRINHLDLKPDNILLDARLEPKITDFGISRCFDEGLSRVYTKVIRGTPGSIAPEIIDTGEITFKSDIYGLGIIIIKLLTGHANYDFENWHVSIDVDGPEVKRCIEIAQQCVAFDQHERPTIGEIMHKLNEIERL